MMNRRDIGCALATGALAMAGLPGARAWAQGNYPERPVATVVPWAPGGSSDAVGRVLAARMSTELGGRGFVVDNRGGANGTLGSAHVARSRPDGYTLLLSSTSTYAIAPHLYPLTFDHERDFAPVGLVAEMPFFMVVPRVSPYRTMAEFIEAARKLDHRLTYGSAAIGASSHVTTEMFLGAAGIEVPDIIYRGGGPMVQGLLQNEVSMVFQASSGILPFMQSGDVRALGVSTLERSLFAPDVPTLHEQGLTGFEAAEHLALLAPAGTPEPLRRRLNEAAAKAMQAPEVQERMRGMGVTPAVQSPDAWAGYLASEQLRWGAVVRSRNIRVQ